MIVDAKVSIYFAGRAWGTAELGYIHSPYVAVLTGRERFDLALVDAFIQTLTLRVRIVDHLAVRRHISCAGLTLGTT